MLVSRSKTWATKDISQENKKSISLFLLKYYHTLNSFTRDDALCTVAILSTVMRLPVDAASGYEARVDGSFHVRLRTLLPLNGAVLSVPPHAARLSTSRSAGMLNFGCFGPGRRCLITSGE